eukprot:scaffold6216_cov149-Amphora_coffeaeformis.AAC.7
METTNRVALRLTGACELLPLEFLPLVLPVVVPETPAEFAPVTEKRKSRLRFADLVGDGVGDNGIQSGVSSSQTNLHVSPLLFPEEVEVGSRTPAEPAVLTLKRKSRAMGRPRIMEGSSSSFFAMPLTTLFLVATIKTVSFSS